MGQQNEETPGTVGEVQRPARFERAARRLIGPRFIDLPIRVLALIEAVSQLLPMAFESDAGGYVALRLGASLLLVLSTFLPLASGALAAGLFLLFVAVYPELLNPFETAMLFAAAVLLARLRWKSSLGLSGALFALNWAAGSVSGHLSTPWGVLLYVWITYSVLALTGAYLEFCIQQEIGRRVTAGREHERELERTRVAFVTDTHDTVSHGLATQAAIIRLLSAERDEAEYRRLLAELTVVNGEAQQELRRTLATLAKADLDGRLGLLPLREELHRAGDYLRAAAEVGGYRLRLHFGELPQEASTRIGDTARFVMRELATNMMKHSTETEGCELTVGLDRDGECLRFESRNRTDRREPVTPRSLRLRAEEHGGTCRATVEGDQFVVQVGLPC